MIEIEIEGIKEKKQKQLYKDATIFYCTQLFKKDPGYLDIILSFMKAPANMNIHGWCLPETNYYPKNFYIEIATKLSQEERLRTLAHEMVHLRQYRKNQLQFKKNQMHWKGQAYIVENEYEMYTSAPWELEAYEMEEVLYNNFITQYNM
jgi:hypothetical protein